MTATPKGSQGPEVRLALNSLVLFTLVKAPMPSFERGHNVSRLPCYPRLSWTSDVNTPLSPSTLPHGIGNVDVDGQCNAMAWHASVGHGPPLASSLKAVSIPSPSCDPGVSCLVSEFHPHSLVMLPDVPYVRALMGKHPSATGAPCGRRLPMSLAAFSFCRSIRYVSELFFSPLALLVDLGSLPVPP